MCLKNKTYPFNPQLLLVSWANKILNILSAKKMFGLLKLIKCLTKMQSLFIFRYSCLLGLLRYFEIFVWDEKYHLFDFLKNTKDRIYRFETRWNILRFFKIFLDISWWEILTSWFFKKWTNTKGPSINYVVSGGSKIANFT